MERITSDALELEYSIAPILARQQSYGILFDIQKAQELECLLLAKRTELKQQLQEVFKPRVISLGEFIPKTSNKKLGTKAGSTYTRIKIEEYNPNSRIQTVSRLCEEFQWKPSEFSDKGNAEFDELFRDCSVLRRNNQKQLLGRIR